MISRDDLLARVRPLVEALAVDLADLLFERIDGQLEAALDVARSALASDLARADAPVELTVEAHRERANRLRREADAAAAARLPNPRRTATCRSCGRVGFTSKGCGTTHEPLAEPPPNTAHRPATRSVPKVATPTTEPEASSSPPPPTRAARGVPAPVPVPSSIPPPVLVEDVEEPAPAEQDDEDEHHTRREAPAPGPRDRFAAIEAAAAARNATPTLRRRSA